MYCTLSLTCEKFTFTHGYRKSLRSSQNCSQRIGLHWPEAGAVESSGGVRTWTWCVCCVANWLWKKPVLCVSTHSVRSATGATANGSIVVVISPLTAIMNDQVSGIKKNKFSPATLVNCCLTNLVWLYTTILVPSLFRLQTLLQEVSLQHMSQDKLAMTTWNRECTEEFIVWCSSHLNYLSQVGNGGRFSVVTYTISVWKHLSLMRPTASKNGKLIFSLLLVLFLGVLKYLVWNPRYSIFFFAGGSPFMLYWTALVKCVAYCLLAWM